MSAQVVKTTQQSKPHKPVKRQTTGYVFDRIQKVLQQSVEGARRAKKFVSRDVQEWN